MTTDSVAHVDRDAGDFHLTAASDCCIASGRPIVDGEDSPTDIEGTPWAEAPSVGPYQYRE